MTALYNWSGFQFSAEHLVQLINCHGCPYLDGMDEVSHAIRHFSCDNEMFPGVVWDDVKRIIKHRCDLNQTI